MNELFQNRLVPSMTAVLLILFSSFASAEISFNYDIRPILAANCFECHGPDQNARKAKLQGGAILVMERTRASFFGSLGAAPIESCPQGRGQTALDKYGTGARNTLP